MNQCNFWLYEKGIFVIDEFMIFLLEWLVCLNLKCKIIKVKLYTFPFYLKKKHKTCYKYADLLLFSPLFSLMTKWCNC